METREQVANYKHKTTTDMLHPMGNFDTEVHSTDRPWCMFNVMMLRKAGAQRSPPEKVSLPADHEGIIFEREAIGRIHVDAFTGIGSHAMMRTVELV